MQLLGRASLEREVLGSSRQSRLKLVDEGSALPKGGIVRRRPVGGGGPGSRRCSSDAVDQSNPLRRGADISALQIPTVRAGPHSTREGGVSK